MVIYVCVCVWLSHLYDCCRLVPLIHHVQFSSAVPLIISDANGDLGGLQPLIAVTLTAAPLIDFLQGKGRQDMDTTVMADNRNTYKWPMSSGNTVLAFCCLQPNKLDLKEVQQEKLGVYYPLSRSEAASFPLQLSCLGKQLKCCTRMADTMTHTLLSGGCVWLEWLKDVNNRVRIGVI